MLALFSVTLLVGAALLFVLQPLVARMVLPLFGGAPAVWNTCVLFFQAALLAGYAYAHWASRCLGLRRHAAIHLVLLAAAGAILPISISAAWAPPATLAPALWLLWLLLATVGLPFFVVSATAPLVQKWFSSTLHTSAKDPYFLYAASNLGSMLALFSYPFLLEPALTLEQQSWLWLGGYGLLFVLLLGCAVLLWRSPAATPVIISEPAKPKTSSGQPLETSLHWTHRLRWLALAFVPSSLMLSVTTYLTTDIAALPLFWVTPLALYLLTFILAFARKPPIPHWLVQRWMPLVVLLVALMLLSEATEPIWLLMLLHLVGLFWVSLACHGELARTRPVVSHLTEFYLWLSLGGVLGGVFNALVAPLLFVTVAEYPLVLVLACLLQVPQFQEKSVAVSAKKNPPKTGKKVKPQPANPAPENFWQKVLRLDVLPAVLLGLFTLALIYFARSLLNPTDPETFQLMVGLSFGPAAVVCYTFLERPIRFGLGIGALFLAGLFTVGIHGHLLHAERSFFGIHRVTMDASGQFYRLVHGNTIHGQQGTQPKYRQEPLTYYHRNSPIGHVFAALEKAEVSLQEVGLVGLGVGSLSAYAGPGQNWTFYEIDPVVLKIARDLKYFTYLRDAVEAGANMSVVIGDARLKLEVAEGKKYDLLIIDAFTSDAVPVHLLTREALDVYLSRLADHGLLVFHISNRYLDLEAVVGELAADAGLRCLSWAAITATEQEKQEGKFGSHWVVMGGPDSPLDQIRMSAPWRELKGGQPQFLWTDQFSNIFSVLRWAGPVD